MLYYIALSNMTVGNTQYIERVYGVKESENDNIIQDGKRIYDIKCFKKKKKYEKNMSQILLTFFRLVGKKN